MPRNTQNEPYAPLARMVPSSPAGGGLFGDESEGQTIVVTNQGALDQGETQRLDHLEATIQRGLDTFYEVGNALVEIRESRLYRQSHGTFEDYCRDKWSMTRQHANRMISAAQIVNDLEPNGSTEGGALPTSEAVARPLARLSPEDRQKAWALAQKWAGVGAVTAAIVEQAAKEIAPHLFESKQREPVAPEPVLFPAPEAEAQAQTEPTQPAPTQGNDDESEEEDADEESEADSASEETPPAPSPEAETASSPAPTSPSSQSGPEQSAPGKPGPKPNPVVASTPPASKPSPAIAAPTPKVPDGFMATFVPRDDCFFLQDEGYSMQSIFSTMRELVEMGQPLGLSLEDLLTTLRTTLGLDEAEDESGK